MTTETHKSVFISYRRNVSPLISRAITMTLHANGYDVFMDLPCIDSGEIDIVSLRQIIARGHFLLICTPGTFDRCDEPGDWLRCEIEHALETERHVVPILVDDFKLESARPHVTGKLKQLLRLSALSVPIASFDEAMDRLRADFLSQPVIGKLITPPEVDESVVKAKQTELMEQPMPTSEELSAEEFFLRALSNLEWGNYDGAIADFDEAIRLNPFYALAYGNRGSVRRKKGDLDSALADYDEAIRLDPKDVQLFLDRGSVRRKKGDLDGALADYDEAIRLDPTYAYAYNNRGYAKIYKGNFDGAIEDASKSIELDPSNTSVYDTRAEAYVAKGDYAAAVADYEKYLALGGGEQDDRIGEIEGKIRDLKRKLEKQKKA